jgi:ABC-type sulfate/molybdate transport systems ATPase subunit
MAYRIECIDVSKRFRQDAPPVLKDINWTVEPGCVVGLVGASGAGKTTLLRAIAGLEPCSTGRVVISREGSIGIDRRPAVGMVFQNLALWPHLTAREHVEYVLGSLPRHQRRERAATLLSATRLPREAWDRRPAELSGGEAQRLALARALAPRPGVLLLDEPLAHVDAALRAELLDLLAELIGATAVTAVFVTHHAAEAMAVSSRVAVMREGRIEMEGSPEKVFWNAPTLDVARLTGPLVRLPRSLFSERLIGSDEATGRPVASAWADEESLYVRPQQLRLVESGKRSEWLATECRPEGAGWKVVLTHGPWQVRLSSPRPVRPGRTVGIDVESRPAPS